MKSKTFFTTHCLWQQEAVKLSIDCFKNNEKVSKYSCKSDFSQGMQCSINFILILTLSIILKLLSFCGLRALFLLLFQIKFPQWFVSFERQNMCVGYKMCMGMFTQISVFMYARRYILVCAYMHVCIKHVCIFVHSYFHACVF